MSFPRHWLCFAAKEVACEAAVVQEALLALGFDVEAPAPAPSPSTPTGWLILKRLAELNAPHLGEAEAQRQLGQKLACALRAQGLVKAGHLSVFARLPSALCLWTLEKLARGTPFAYVYARESAGLWKLCFEEGVALPFCLGLWEVLGAWLGKNWAAYAGPASTLLFVQEARR